MNKFFLFITLSLGFSGVASAQFINWSAPVDINGSTGGNKYPRIVCNAQNEAMITWSAQQNVYFTRQSGSVFSTPQPVNLTYPAYTASWTGADISAKGDTIYIVFMHNVWKQKTYITSSFNGGNTFNTPGLIETYPDSTSRFPMVCTDNQGQPIVGIMKMDTNGLHPHYVVRKSNDHGLSFYTEANAGGWSSAASEACDCCPGAIIRSGNNALVAYRDNDANIRDIWMGFSTNNAGSFSNGIAVDNNNWNYNSCPSTGPDMAIIGDTVYSVFYNGATGNKVYLSRTSISQQVLHSVELLNPVSTANQNYPRISSSGNSLAIVWIENLAGQRRILCKYYADIHTNNFILDTVYTGNPINADISFENNTIHIACEEGSSTVKYFRGTIFPTTFSDFQKNRIDVYPNPALYQLYIKNPAEESLIYQISDLNGKVIQQNKAVHLIDISGLSPQNYFIRLYNHQGTRVAEQLFTRGN